MDTTTSAIGCGDLFTPASDFIGERVRVSDCDSERDSALVSEFSVKVWFRVRVRASGNLVWRLIYTSLRLHR